jgi:hypothetical protein
VPEKGIEKKEREREQQPWSESELEFEITQPEISTEAY